MSGMIDMAKRCYRTVHRRLHPSPNPFPVDAWTDETYPSWFEAHKASADGLARQREAWDDFAIKPTFSFIVPLYKTSHEFLHTMADSVLAQTYPNLQLVLINASPEVVELAGEVDAYRARDERVTVVTLERNLGITENTNEGLAAATGDFCCFLDHDDFIEPNLLFEYVRAINAEPEIDVLYCDEDLVSRDVKTGAFRPKHVLFKPDYAPELLLCKNYIVHLMTIRKSIIDVMPRPDARFDGSQDYNMVLYATHAARKVHAVHKVLYHWRISENSTATNPESKPYTLRSCRLAMAAGYARRGLDATVMGMGIYLLYAPWFALDAHASVSVIVRCGASPVLDTRFVELFQQNNSCKNVQLVLVGYTGEPANPQGTHISYVDAPAKVSRYAAYNAGAAAAEGECLLFLDATCHFLTAEPLEQLHGILSIDGVGVSAPKVLYRDGRVKNFGVAMTPERIMPLYRGYEDEFPGYQCNLRAMQNASAVSSQGLCTSRALFERLGGFDESFESEVGAADYCKRVHDAGYRLVVTPTVKLEVDEAAPECYFRSDCNAPDFSKVDIARYDAKWPGARAAGDPYLNPNLDQASCYLQLPHAAGSKHLAR